MGTQILSSHLGNLIKGFTLIDQCWDTMLKRKSSFT
jgi:hypothetical protein